MVGFELFSILIKFDFYCKSDDDINIIIIDNYNNKMIVKI